MPFDVEVVIKSKIKWHIPQLCVNLIQRRAWFGRLIMPLARPVFLTFTSYYGILNYIRHGGLKNDTFKI